MKKKEDNNKGDYVVERLSLRRVFSLSGDGGLRLLFTTLFYPERPLFLGSFRAYLAQGRIILQIRYVLRFCYFLLKRGFSFDVIQINEKTKHNEHVVDHNLWDNFNIFHFSRGRIEHLLYLLELAGAKKAGQTLSIGPKNEGEILLFKAHDFKNVVGIDLFTHCPSIKVMDVHGMTFEDNSFDTINCGWILAYVYDINTVVKEIIRVARPGAIIACGVTPPQTDVLLPYQGVVLGGTKLLSLFAEHVGHVYWRGDDVEGKKFSLVFQLKK